MNKVKVNNRTLSKTACLYTDTYWMFYVMIVFGQDMIEKLV